MMNIDRSSDAKRRRVDAGAGSKPSGDDRYLHHYKQQQQIIESDDRGSEPPTADGKATQALPHSITAGSQGVVENCENDSNVDFEDEGLHELLGPTPRTNQHLHPAAEQLRQHAITDPATVREKIKTLAVALAEEAGCTHKLPLVSWKDDKNSARTCGRYQAHIIAGVSMRVRASENILSCV